MLKPRTPFCPQHQGARDPQRHIIFVNWDMFALAATANNIQAEQRFWDEKIKNKKQFLFCFKSNHSKSWLGHVMLPSWPKRQLPPILLTVTNLGEVSSALDQKKAIYKKHWHCSCISFCILHKIVSDGQSCDFWIMNGLHVQYSFLWIYKFHSNSTTDSHHIQYTSKPK